MSNYVVANLLTGQVLKGVSLDVDPTKPVCHIRTDQGVAKVKLAETKALFFVRDLTGNPARQDAQEPPPGDTRHHGATKIEIRFKDGERLVAYTNRYPPRGAHYYVVPVDAAGNNTRVLVNQAAVAGISLT